MKENKAGTQGRKLDAETVEECCLLVCFPRRARTVSLCNPGPLSQGWHRPQWAGPSYINHQENAPTDSPTQQSDGAFSQLRFSLYTSLVYSKSTNQLSQPVLSVKKQESVDVNLCWPSSFHHPVPMFIHRVAWISIVFILTTKILTVQTDHISHYGTR